MTAKPDGSEWWEVAAVEPERFLALRMSLDLPVAGRAARQPASLELVVGASPASVVAPARLAAEAG